MHHYWHVWQQRQQPWRVILKRLARCQRALLLECLAATPGSLARRMNCIGVFGNNSRQPWKVILKPQACCQRWSSLACLATTPGSLKSDLEASSMLPMLAFIGVFSNDARQPRR
ncbi:hypothetical protein Ahy_A01g001962 isoform C [Arachis hypogaea]|uniref:Uncharacterized protein n=1 Tax=Arachis hypogaea TaxID=3818 RepID=A0A445EQ53_ARAHY|nr:hypothetical protein Ahy_A01g001962 isoform C [Arachis hypogaea]